MKPMNLLIIMSDQHTRRMTGAYGHSIVKTPNLDQLASSGVRFDNAYVNCPICVPSRATFMTGRYNHDTDHWDNGHPWTGNPDGWSHRLSSQGHQVTTIGKLHFRSETDDNGIDDSRIAMNVFNEVGDYWGSIRWQTAFQGYKGDADDAGPGESHYTRFDRAVTQESVKWLHEDAPADKPWCLKVSLGCPHPPLISPEEFYNLYDLDELDMPIAWQRKDWPDHPYWNTARPWRLADKSENALGRYSEDEIRNAVASYYGLVSFMDHNVGLVLDALESSGQASNTRVIYTSDHGEMLGGHGLWGKMCMYEDSVGSPLILSGPDLPSGEVRKDMASWVDIFPTVLDCVGAEAEAIDSTLPGTSLWPIAQGKSAGDRTVFSEYHATKSHAGNFMICNEQYKYIHYEPEASQDPIPPQLFDRSSDPQETNDLGQDPNFQPIRDQLHDELLKVCNPQEVNAAAFASQRRLVALHGGEDKILADGPPFKSATPTPAQFYEDGAVPGDE